MSDNDNDLQVSKLDELAALKERADMMGISYHPSIGLEKLRDKVNAAIQGEPEEQEAPVAVAAGQESEQQKLVRMKNEATKLVRIRLTCMNPAKKEWDGQYFSVGNAVVGNLTKYVPFHADEGWHVPHLIYQDIVNRQCQVFVTAVDSRGNKTRRGKLIKEFSVEVLPPLTKEELQELAQRQAMSGSIDN